MHRVEVTWGKTLKVWWSYVWRCVLFGALLGLVAGFFGGLIVGMIGKPELGAVIGGTLGYIGGIPVSMYFLKKILDKKYSDFSVALVSEDDNQ